MEMMHQGLTLQTGVITHVDQMTLGQGLAGLPRK